PETRLEKLDLLRLAGIVGNVDRQHVEPAILKPLRRPARAGTVIDQRVARLHPAKLPRVLAFEHARRHLAVLLMLPHSLVFGALFLRHRIKHGSVPSGWRTGST